MRLDKFIAQQLEISRANASRELRARRVTVNGEVIRDGAFQVTSEQHICWDNRPLRMLSGPRYFMLHKPQGYVCSTDDPLHPTVLFFLNEPAAGKLHAAGRLDIDTTGLVLLTDDGQWSHRITSPRHHCEKDYLVTLSEPVRLQTVRQFAEGILLRGEKIPTKPAVLTMLSERQGRLTLREGRYHQVKRMFAAVGNHVLALHRERIGNIVLDPQLKPGEYRALMPAEIANVTLCKEEKVTGE